MLSIITAYWLLLWFIQEIVVRITMRIIKHAPSQQRFALCGRTLNSKAKPLTVWFNNVLLVESSDYTAVRARWDDWNGHFIVEVRYNGGDVKEILRVPDVYGHLIEVSR